MIGQRLLHYEIVQKLGEGGMGVVYKARDTHLDRFVAIKVLPPEKVADASRKARFVQEAKAASALNHPNIVVVHDIASEAGHDFMVMEYISGKTLEQLIGRKGLALNETLKYAIQISDALARAHGAGIVHRDLKPSNVMVDEHGLVKVLDFGLAKLTEILPTDEDASTQTVRAATEEGTILGTAAYMSPEQAEGKKVDVRSDIFSFGSVLYEMVSGRRAFQGDSKMSTLSAILHQEPKPIEDVPHDLKRIISHCLRKDPERRFQNMKDVKVELEELKEESDSGKLAPAPASRHRKLWPWILAGVSAAALLLAAFLVWRTLGPASTENLSPVALTSYPGVESQPSFSPDGNKVAFVWNGEKQDNHDVYIKQIGSTGPPLRLTSDPARESSPTWSPDDRWIAFIRRQQGSLAIIVTPPLGGEERRLAEMPSLSGLSWTPDAKWLAFGAQESPQRPYDIRVVNIETREVRQLTGLSSQSAAAKAGQGDRDPRISPDGRTLAFSRQASAFLYELWTLPLTPDLQPGGEPEKIAEKLDFFADAAWTADGREIVYSAGRPDLHQLWRVPVPGQRNPKRIAYMQPAALNPAISPTRSRLVYSWNIRSTSIWRLDTRTKESGPVITSTRSNLFPQYSPDGRKIAFGSNRGSEWQIWTCGSDGTNCAQISNYPGSAGGRWSPDGRWLAADNNTQGQYEILIFPADGGAPRNFTTNPADDIEASWSLDGRWIYFASNRSGRHEVWRAPKDGGDAIQVTRSGGRQPFESPDGNLYYLKSGVLTRMPAGGGPETELLPNLKLEYFIISRKCVYFFAPDSKSIMQLDQATRKLTKLATANPEHPHVGVSPDDAYVVWTQVQQNTQDLMLVENFR